MMKTNDLENELRNLKFTHLTESELALYEGKELDEVSRTRVEAHLNQCFICKRQLELLREENEALNNYVVTPDDITFVEGVMAQAGLVQKPLVNRPVKTASEVGLRERLRQYLEQMAASWLITFRPVRHSDPGKELWQWQSDDGHLRARATMQENADIIVYFSSNEMELEGARIRFHLSLLNQEVTLERISESEVAAQIAVPWRYRRNMTDFSIEFISE
jgi:hypothetical protein